MSPIETTTSIFNSKKRSIFDEDTKFEPAFPSTDHDDHYDPTNSWVFTIYQDQDVEDEQSLIQNETNNPNDDQDEDENRAPRVWRTRKEEKKLTRSSSHQDNASYQRLPLQEIKLEDYTSDDEPPARKKASVTTNENTHKIRFIRTLSPTRNAKRKGKETAENIMPI